MAMQTRAPAPDSRALDDALLLVGDAWRREGAARRSTT